MATFYGSTNSVEWGLRIDVYELPNTQNIANNTSVVRVDLFLGRTRSNGYCGGNFNGSISVGGQVQNYSGTIAYPTNISAGQYIYTGITKDFTIGHNADGSMTVGASASWGANFTPSSGNVSGTLVLSNIPRQANITGANNFNDEQNPSFTFSPAGAGTLNVWLEPNPTGDHLCIRNNIPNTGSYTWNLTEEERNQLRAKCNTNSCTCRIGLYTIINGTTYISYIDKTMTIVNGNPTFSNFTYKDTNSIVTSVIGTNQAFVKGLSNLQISISTDNKMIANKKATPKNYVATIDNINISTDYSESDLTIDLGTILSAGEKRLNVRAYDSRNNSTLVYKDITVYDYNKPVINATVTRLNNFENQTTLSVSGEYSKLTINGTDKNVVTTLQYRYRESRGTWSNWTNLTSEIADGKFHCNNVILSLDNTKAFEFEVKATDKLSDSTINLYLDIGQAIFFISSNKKACYINGQEILTYDIVDEW